MDKKRAAIVASAGVGLLVSAVMLHKWNTKRRSSSEESPAPKKRKRDAQAVVMSDGSAMNGGSRFGKALADGA